ncbi:mechanosensitive ion channel family protein [Sphingomonas sp. Sphisp140]|uniref:mechanosensitive ion channel family protein n=1 Tax=unclassified Sphingomonas TaxID=196159 RepID=UPI0039AF8766
MGDAAATPSLTTFARRNLSDRIDVLTADGSAWIGSHWLEIVVALVAGALIFVLLQFLKGWGLRLCKKGQGVATWYSILGRALARTGQFFIIMTSARLVSGYAGPPPAVQTTVAFLFTISAVFQAAIWTREIIFGAIEHRTQEQGYRGQGLASALGIIRLLVTITLFAVAVIVVLSNLGVNVTGLIAGLGVGGIAIGLAAQGIFADLFAALAIIFDKPFRLGDSISYDKGAGSGEVMAIGLKSTRIRGPNGEERIIANRRLLDFEILNTTRRARNRFKFDFHLGYATPPELIRRLPSLFGEVVESEGYTLVHGGVNGFSDNGLSYDVEFESIETDFPPEARDRVAAALLACLRDNQVSFAYPTMVNLLAEKTKPTPPATVRDEAA